MSKDNQATKLIDVEPETVIEVGKCISHTDSVRELISDIGNPEPDCENTIVVLEKWFHPQQVEDNLAYAVEEFRQGNPGEEPDLEELRKDVLAFLEAEEFAVWRAHEAVVLEPATGSDEDRLTREDVANVVKRVAAHLEADESESSIWQNPYPLELLRVIENAIQEAVGEVLSK